MRKQLRAIQAAELLQHQAEDLLQVAEAQGNGEGMKRLRSEKVQKCLQALADKRQPLLLKTYCAEYTGGSILSDEGQALDGSAVNARGLDVVMGLHQCVQRLDALHLLCKQLKLAEQGEPDIADAAAALRAATRAGVTVPEAVRASLTFTGTDDDAFADLMSLPTLQVLPESFMSEFACRMRLLLCDERCDAAKLSLFLHRLVKQDLHPDLADLRLEIHHLSTAVDVTAADLQSLHAASEFFAKSSRLHRSFWALPLGATMMAAMADRIQMADSDRAHESQVESLRLFASNLQQRLRHVGQLGHDEALEQMPEIAHLALDLHTKAALLIVSCSSTFQAKCQATLASIDEAVGDAAAWCQQLLSEVFWKSTICLAENVGAVVVGKLDAAKAQNSTLQLLHAQSFKLACKEDPCEGFVKLTTAAAKLRQCSGCRPWRQVQPQRAQFAGAAETLFADATSSESVLVDFVSGCLLAPFTDHLQATLWALRVFTFRVSL